MQMIGKNPPVESSIIRQVDGRTFFNQAKHRQCIWQSKLFLLIWGFLPQINYHFPKLLLLIKVSSDYNNYFLIFIRKSAGLWIWNQKYEFLNESSTILETWILIKKWILLVRVNIHRNISLKFIDQKLIY